MEDYRTDRGLEHLAPLVLRRIGWSDNGILERSHQSLLSKECTDLSPPDPKVSVFIEFLDIHFHCIETVPLKINDRYLLFDLES